MLSLKILIPPEYIEQSEKLQTIETGWWHKIPNKRHRGKFKHITVTEHKIDSRWYDYMPAIDIADVIDNGEMLFGNIEKEIVSKILYLMCHTNKSIEEISEYIIKNIK